MKDPNIGFSPFASAKLQLFRQPSNENRNIFRLNMRKMFCGKMFAAFILHYVHFILSLHRQNTSMEIHFAPLQRYTDFEYRRIHARHCGGVQTYYSPFIRWEKGGIRVKDIRDILPENNEGLHLVPPRGSHTCNPMPESRSLRLSGIGFMCLYVYRTVIS